jgi:hypothetical protein
MVQMHGNTPNYFTWICRLEHHLDDFAVTRSELGFSNIQLENKMREDDFAWWKQRL